jgi:hypothetical protein
LRLKTPWWLHGRGGHGGAAGWILIGAGAGAGGKGFSAAFSLAFWDLRWSSLTLHFRWACIVASTAPTAMTSLTYNDGGSAWSVIFESVDENEKYAMLLLCSTGTRYRYQWLLSGGWRCASTRKTVRY